MVEDADDGRTLTFTLPDSTSWRFRNWHTFERWLNAFSDRWAWVDADMTGPDPTGTRPAISARLRELRAEGKALKSQGQPVTEMHAAVRRLLFDQFAPYHPDSQKGALIFDIYDQAGIDSAIFAFALMRQQVSFSQISTPEQFRGAMMSSVPVIGSIAQSGDALAKERNNYRSAVRRLSQEMDEVEHRRGEDWNTSLRAAGDAGLAWSQRRARRWLRYTRLWRGRNETAIASIKAVENSYREAMALKAPVEYWTSKAKAHGIAEGKARGLLYWYFPVAFLLIVILFAGSAVYLLNVPRTTMPPGLYFIASAGLASAAGLLFWVGRLLTKLYLSQHHLRHDAEERATMTTTYLALTAENAAADADRQIILSALFRSTSDGIVKEDGALDMSVPAQLGRLLAK